MDYLQYFMNLDLLIIHIGSFKPYYKWITFNIVNKGNEREVLKVLNLIINGLPSIYYWKTQKLEFTLKF